MTREIVSNDFRRTGDNTLPKVFETNDDPYRNLRDAYYTFLADLRASFGTLSDQICHKASDPNKVTIVLNWNSLPNAQKMPNLPS